MFNKKIHFIFLQSLLKRAQTFTARSKGFQKENFSLSFALQEKFIFTVLYLLSKKIFLSFPFFHKNKRN